MTDTEEALKKAFSSLTTFIHKNVDMIPEDDPTIILPKNFDTCFPRIMVIIQALSVMLKLRIEYDVRLVLDDSNCVGALVGRMTEQEFLAHLQQNPSSTLTEAYRSLCIAFAALESIDPQTVTSVKDVGHSYVYHLYGKYFQKIYYNVSIEKIKMLLYVNESVEAGFLNNIRELAPLLASFPNYIRGLFHKLTYFLILRYREREHVGGKDKLFAYANDLYVSNAAATERLFKRAPAKRLKANIKGKKSKNYVPKDSDYETYIRVHKPYINLAKVITTLEDLEVVKKVNVSLQDLGGHLLLQPTILNQEVRKHVLTTYIDNFHAKAAEFSRRLESRKRHIHDTLVRNRESDPAFQDKSPKEKKDAKFTTEQWKTVIDIYLRNNSEEIKNWADEIFSANLSNGYSVRIAAISEYRSLMQEAQRLRKVAGVSASSVSSSTSSQSSSAMNMSPL